MAQPYAFVDADDGRELEFKSELPAYVVDSSFSANR